MMGNNMIRIIFMGMIILGNNESNHSRGFHYSWQQWNRPAPIVSSTWTRTLLGVAWKLIESIFMIIILLFKITISYIIDIHTLEWICRREWKQLWPHPVPSGKQPQACSWGKVWLPTLLGDQIIFQLSWLSWLSKWSKYDDHLITRPQRYST